MYNLKLSELQVVLDAVKDNKTGSKQSLCNHVIKLLTASKPLTQVLKQKIFQVYNSRTQQNQQPRVQVVRLQHALQQSRNLTYNQSYTPLRLIPVPNQQFKPIHRVSTQFENLPFMKTIHCLLTPMLCKTIKYSNITGVFCLTDNNITNTIVKSWNKAKHEYKTQIVLRFFSFCKKTKRLPYNMTVSVNGRQCKLPTLNTTNCQMPWRDNVPIDITLQTNLRNYSENLINVTWSKEQHEYMAGVYVIQKLTLNDLLEQLKKRPSRTYQNTQEFIKKSMESDADMGVDSMLITLQDPLTKLRMKFPARGVECIHLQCFDVIQFLQMNEQKQTWSCPICKKNVKFDDIEIDDFFLNMLQSSNLSKECENIILLKDGTWTEKKTEEFSNSFKTSNKQPTNNIGVITLSDTDDDDDDDDYNNNDLDNDDNDESLPNSKRFKCNPPKVEESIILSKHIAASSNLIKANVIHSTKSDRVKNLSFTASSNHESIKLLNDPFIKPTCTKPVSNLLNNTYLPNNRISVTNKKNFIASSRSGSSQSNKHQGKNQSKPVLFVITLD